MTCSSIPRVLVIAGSDSSGGAGIVRDLRVLTDHQVVACCAITAVTAQTDRQLIGTHHVPPPAVQQQITAALTGFRIDAIKIGMLGTAATVNAVLAALDARLSIPVVLDPVLQSSSGGRLLDAEGIELMRERLLPRTSLLTPNIPELAALLKAPLARDEAELLAQARSLLSLGVKAILIKGGHAAGEVATDLLVSLDGGVQRFSAPRLAMALRGTGCALASAIAARLAQGAALATACREAKTYVFDLFKNLATEEARKP